MVDPKIFTDFSLSGIVNMRRAVLDAVMEDPSIASAAVEAFAQLRKNQKETGCMDGLCMDKTEVTESAYARVMGKSPSSNGPNMPVTLVSYNNAEEYCKRVGKRLPSGSEWEKFAGPNEFATHDGKLVDSNGKKEANFDSKGPMDVKSFEPNSNGMFDMTGNVWEWVSGGSIFKDLRGGSWGTSDSGYLRVAYRDGDFFPGAGSADVGFRCVSSEDSK